MKSVYLAFALALLGCGGAAGQVYPSRPVTIVAPFPPGGPSDALSRVISGPLAAALGQPVVIENVGGAGGNIGVERVARATPDGYTLLIGQFSTHVVNPVTYHLPYDIVNDFEPIALLANTPQIIIARKDFPAKDVQEFIAWLKSNPDKGQAATVGAAGGAQVAGMYFQQVTGTSFGFVPYRGGAQAMQDLMAGRVDFMFDQAANAITQVRAGSIKAYAVMAAQRWQSAPDLPTIDEAGAPALHLSYWHALWAPKGTPREIIATINAAVVGVLADPAVRQRLALQGQDIWPRDRQTPQALAAFYAAETAKWWPIIRAEHLTAE